MLKDACLVDLVNFNSSQTTSLREAVSSTAIGEFATFGIAD